MKLAKDTQWNRASGRQEGVGWNVHPKALLVAVDFEAWD